jgi:hypothetical protein
LQFRLLVCLAHDRKTIVRRQVSTCFRFPRRPLSGKKLIAGERAGWTSVIVVDFESDARGDGDENENASY